LVREGRSQQRQIGRRKVRKNETKKDDWKNRTKNLKEEKDRHSSREVKKNEV
jgi:hypothetical protein